MLSIEHLCCKVGAFFLQDVCLAMEPDEYFVLLGPTGSGKTTLLKCIAGLCPAVGGRISLAGRDLTSIDPALRRIGYLPQDYKLFPHLDVRSNILFGPSLRGMRRDEAERRLGELSDMLRIGHLLKRRIDCLSGGEMQRVALARALIIQPRALLLDEPFSAVDPGLRTHLWFEVKALLKSLNIPVIHVTHNLVEASATADRLCVLIGGRVEQVGPPDEIFSRPATENAARYQGIRNIFCGEVVERDERTVTVQCRGFRIRAPVAAGPSNDAGLGASINCDFAAGAKVRVCVRPQDIKIIREGYPVRPELRDNLIECEVISSFLCSEFHTVMVRCGEDIEIRLPADIIERHDLHPGKKITIGVWQRNIMVFPRDATSS